MTSRPKEAEKRKPSVDAASQSADSSPSHEETDGRIKFTESKVDAICDRVRAGTWVEHSCLLEGVTIRGLEKAMHRDETIAIKVGAARAENAERLRSKMDMTLGDWKREAWQLERWDRVTFKPPKAESEVKSESKNEHTVSATVLVVTEAEMLAGAGRKIEGDG